jgi:hypothetical protein
MNLHVLPNFKYAFFDFWMCIGGMDTFALVINYLDETWTPMHVIIGLFEVHKTIGNTIVLQLLILLEKIGLIYCVINFVKNEGNNLGTMATTLQSIIDCEL